MQDAIDAGDATLHTLIDRLQDRARDLEADLLQRSDSSLLASAARDLRLFLDRHPIHRAFQGKYNTLGNLCNELESNVKKGLLP
jgi:hypothetical protein